jgi:heme/copper-type cytochrome/quinol oxidase subunit 4
LQQAAAEDSATVAQAADAVVPAVVVPAASPVPVEGGGQTDPPVVVEAAMPAKERSTKSLVSTLTAGLGSVALTIGALATKGAGWLKDNPEIVVLFALAIVAIVVCYLLYQHRQTKLDLADRQHAKEVTLETMRIRSDPALINVEVVPRAVPPEAPKG